MVRHVRLALDVPDQRIRRVRQRVVVHAEAQTRARQVRLEVRPRRVVTDQVCVHVGVGERHL